MEYDNLLDFESMESYLLSKFLEGKNLWQFVCYQQFQLLWQTRSRTSQPYVWILCIINLPRVDKEERVNACPPKMYNLPGLFRGPFSYWTTKVQFKIICRIIWDKC